jgi:hypothetical protein
MSRILTSGIFSLPVGYCSSHLQLDATLSSFDYTWQTKWETLWWTVLKALWEWIALMFVFCLVSSGHCMWSFLLLCFPSRDWVLFYDHWFFFCMFLHMLFDILHISLFVSITTVRILHGRDSFYLHCLVYSSMVRLRVLFDAPLNSQAVFLLLTVKRRRPSVFLRSMSSLFHTVLIPLVCPLLFSRLR